MKTTQFSSTPNLFFILTFFFLALGCKKQIELSEECVAESTLLSKFENTDGNAIRIYDNGEAYMVENGNCEFVTQYFNPNFFEETYQRANDGTSLIIDENTLFPTVQNVTEDFENITDFRQLFLQDINQQNRIFTNITLQSPTTPTVEEYLTLQNCLLNNTCDFNENRIDLVADPKDANNMVIKFSSVAKGAEMVTAKSSIISTLLFFEQGDDFWFEARFLVDGALPTTLADFESSHFFGSPGPRILISGGMIAIENKFGDKAIFKQNQNQKVEFPKNQWVTLKVHLQYDEENGVIQLWQDEQLVIDHTGKNMPLPNWIQDRLEIGITATNEETELYMDDVRFSDEGF